MSKQRISILIETEPPKEIHPVYKHKSIEERVRECILAIESGEDSKREWELIKKLNNELMRHSRLSPRAKNVLRLIKPIIDKYGLMDSDKVEQDPTKNLE